MRLRPKHAWFLAFVAVFAALAGFVFWGTWSLGMCPVMPDCPTSYPLNYVETWARNWLANGKFVPGDAIVFLGSPYFWNELRYVMAAFFAALGMAYFLRGRGLPRVAAYGAGLLLAFSGYWFTLFSAGHLGWFQWMTYGVFAFGLIDRALEKGKARHWLMLGAVLAWGSFNQPDLWLLFTVFQAAYFVFRAVVVFRARMAEARFATASAEPAAKGVHTPAGRAFLAVRPALVSAAKGAAMALAAFVVIGLPSFRSAIFSDLAGRDKQIEEGQTVGGAAKDDAEKRWIFVTNWSLPPAETREFFSSRINGDTSCPFTLAIGEKQRTGVREYTGALGRPYGASAGNYRQHSLYVGKLTCLLALLGGMVAFLLGFATPNAGDPAAKSRSTIVFFAVSAVVFWLFSMGRYCEPVYRLVYALPMGDYLRAPVKWHHLTEFCICVLAGYGLWGMMLANKWMSDRVKVALASALVLVGAIDLAGNARLYCAPHRADAEMQFADASQLQNPQMQSYLDKNRIRVIGRWSSRGAALLEVPKKREAEKIEWPKTPPATLAMFGASALATVGVSLFAALAALRRRKERK